MVVWAGSVSFLGTLTERTFPPVFYCLTALPNCLLELVYRDHTRASYPEACGHMDTYKLTRRDTWIHALAPSCTYIQASSCTHFPGYSSQKQLVGQSHHKGILTPDQDGTLLYSFSVFLFHGNQILERTHCTSIYTFSEAQSKEKSC